MTHLVYAHSAAGTVFYIGLGQDARPYTRIGRNYEWQRIVRENNDHFDVEILHSVPSRSLAKKLEAQEIKRVKPIANYAHNRPSAPVDAEAFVTIRGLSVDLWRQIKSAAIEHDQTIAEYVTVIFQQAVEGKGE